MEKDNKTLAEKYGNKLPKLLQHERLQKEEDEEHWISGEELCTDGSSDEEKDLNDGPRRPKTKIPAKKSLPTATSLKLNATEGEEKMENSANEFGIEWRPKRGSIKLPPVDQAYFNYDDDDEEEITTNTKMCIEQTIQNIEKFKQDFDIPNPTIIPKPKPSETDKKTEEEILRERIAVTERQLKDVLNNLKNNEAERMQFETEICEHLKEFSKDPYQIMSNRRFFNICKFESNELPDIESVKDAPSNETKSYKSMTKEEFVQIEMNKLNPKVPNLMTDEEKTRLNTMLSDLEENEETDDGKMKEQTSDDDETGNAFEIFQDEKEYLNEIDNKLKTLETNPDQNRDNVALTTNDWLTIMKEKDEKLKEIDRKLRRIKEIDEKLKQTENKVKLEIDKVEEPFTSLLNLPLAPEEKQIIEKIIAEKIALVKQTKKTIGEQDVPTTVETKQNENEDYFTADEKRLIETIKTKQNH